jgi:hypothetical protein
MFPSCCRPEKSKNKKIVIEYALHKKKVKEEIICRIETKKEKEKSFAERRNPTRKK